MKTTGENHRTHTRRQILGAMLFAAQLVACKSEPGDSTAASVTAAQTIGGTDPGDVTTGDQGATGEQGTATGEQGTTSDEMCPGVGFLGCPCTDDGKCLEGLKCLASLNLCIDPSELTTGGGASGDGSTTEPECLEGLEGCPCAGDLCVFGLECIQGLCQAISGDDTGEALCVGDYEPCESQFNCCELDQHCLDFSNTNGGGVVCAPECSSHTECPSRCCGGVKDLGLHVCYSAPCDSLCANTCAFANDGACDDGGPASEYDVCEYGTDCGDCGSRPSEGAPWA